MAKKTQSRAQAKAASKSRPASTSQPTSSSATLAPITAFSPFSPHFAILTQAIDRHRLTIYSTSSSGTSRLLVDYVLPSGSSDSTQSAQCSALCWVKLPSSASSSTNESPQAKRQKKGGRASLNAAEETTTASSKPVLALGLQSGQVHLFDLSQGKVIRVLTDAAAGTSSASASNAITSMSYATDASASKLYATAKDGVVRVWFLQAAAAALDSSASASTSGLQPTGKVTLQSQSSAPNTLVSVSPSASHLLVANHTITRIDESTSSTKSSYTSHASPMTHLTWIDDEHFVSAAKNDPVLYVWKSARSKAPIGTIELEQGEDVIRVESRAGVVVVVGSQGFVGVYDTAALVAEDTVKGTKLVKATSTSTSSSLVDVRLDEAGGRLDLARLVKGVKLDLASTQIKDPATSSLLSVLSIPKTSANANLLASGDDSTVTTGNSSLQRYSDATAMAGKQSGANSSSAPVGSDGMLIEGNSRLAEDQDDALNQEGGGVDDERSLEDRLRGLRVIRKATRSKKAGGDDSSSESDEDEDAATSRAGAPNTSLSLATSLSQALHSSDSSLISSLLTSANPDLVKGTVLRISGPNAVLLLEACVTRLNASKRGPQKARGMVEWIKWTLRLHAGYLMSLPGLTSRLASLHSSLSARLNGHDRMLALQGRLELVLGQIELRADYDVVKAKVQGASARPGAGVARIEKEGKVWKEDEDDSDEEEEDVEEVGEGMDVDEDGSAAEDDDDEDDDSDSDSDDDEDDSDIDVEAEEEEGDVEDVGLDSRVNGSSVSKAGAGAASSDDDDDEDDIVRPASRLARKIKPAAGKGKKGKAASPDESEEDDDDDDELMEGSEDEEEDEEDESDLLDDDDDEDDEDDEDEDEDGEGGLIDDEAEEASEDEEEESSEEE